MELNLRFREWDQKTMRCVVFQTIYHRSEYMKPNYGKGEGIPNVNSVSEVTRDTVWTRIKSEVLRH